MFPLTGGDFVSGGALLIIFGALLAYLRNVPVALYYLFERCFITRIDIQEEDESFQWIKLWLADVLKGTLSISVFTRKNEIAPKWEDDPSEVYKFCNDVDTTDKRPRVIFTPAPGWYWFFYNNRLVTVSRNRIEPQGKGTSVDLKPRESFSMRIFSRDLGVAKKLIEEARDHALPKDGKVEIRTSNQNYWNLSSRIRPRPIESVVLADDTAHQVLEDIRRFKKSADWYTRLGVPYRRGYLLVGPPGNGKSSFVLSIASELGMNVNVLNLSANGMSDTQIIDLMTSVDTNTLVLIEDIDCAFLKRKSGIDRKEKLSGLTFSGVLNALDGIMAQDGRILFMTTNHPEKLDPALTRPGRADVKVYIGNATQDQVCRLFCRFHPTLNGMAERFAREIPNGKVSMAKIQHHLMLYRDNAELAVARADEVLKVESYEKAPTSAVA